ncbi:MAG: hypothetical protein WC712_13015 [Candidatus Brocadiia bacterium]
MPVGRAFTRFPLSAMAVAVLAVSLLVAACGPALGEERGCPTCGNSGKVECRIHKDAKAPAFQCSCCYECPKGCWGLGWMPCPNKDCISPHKAELAEEFKRLFTERKSWVDSRRAAVEGKVFSDNGKTAGVKAWHVETAHFRFASTIKPRKVRLSSNGAAKTLTFDSHQAMHLYAQRIEEAFATCMKLLDFTGDYKPTVTDKFLLMVWQSVGEQNAASQAFCHSAQPAGASVDGLLYSTHDANDDMYLHHKLVHAIAHLVCDDYGGIVMSFPPWLREAFAQWVEYEVCGELAMVCVGDFDKNVGCPKRRIKSGMKMQVKGKSKDNPPLSSFIDNRVADMTGWHRIKGICILDWMLNGYSRKVVGPLVVQCKKGYPKVAQEALFKAVLDKTPDQVDELWGSWVLETYPDNENNNEKLTPLPEGM